MNIICFLCLQPSTALLEFASVLSNSAYKIYICVDSNDYKPEVSNWPMINFIQPSEAVCKDAGYTGIVSYFFTRPCSKDKALWYFNAIETDYEHLWLIEDDVFIPHPETVFSIDRKFPSADILIPPIEQLDIQNWYWANVVKSQFQILYNLSSDSYFDFNSRRPRLKSMTCAMRLSRTFMKNLECFVTKFGTLIMDELLIPYLAKTSNLVVVEPNELKTVVFEKSGAPNRHQYCSSSKWEIPDINANYLYHPVKNQVKHVLLRRGLYLLHQGARVSSLRRGGIWCERWARSLARGTTDS